MIVRAAVGLGAMAAAVAVVCMSWPGQLHASVERAKHAPSLLDDAYVELEREMRPHGCLRCHAPDTLLENRRSLELVLEENLMPPEDDDHPAGIDDELARARLLHRVRLFRALGDAALASW